MKLKSRNVPDAVNGELNMTSMTDVIFILLIFFIMLSEIRTASVEVSTPEVSAAPTPDKKDGGPPAVLSITKDAKLFLDAAELPLPGIIAALRERGAREATPPRVRIRGDGAVDYAKFVEVMVELTQAGFQDIEIAVQSKK